MCVFHFRMGMINIPKGFRNSHTIGLQVKVQIPNCLMVAVSG